MKLLQAVFLSLFVSLAAFAAPPVLSFEGADAVVTVPAGHRVVWVYGGSSKATGLVTDSDGDGQVRFTPPFTRSLMVADLETGEWAVSQSVRTSVLGPGELWSITPDATGAHSIFDTPKANTWQTLWLRPGVGAWIPPARWGEPLAEGKDFLLVDISTFEPVGASPPAPSGVVRGDSWSSFHEFHYRTGLVDSTIDSPYPGRLYFEDGSTSHVEGRTITIDVIRRLGTEGTVTTTCAPTFVAVTPLPAGTLAEPAVDYEAFTPQELTFGPGEFLRQCTFTLLDDGVFTDLPRFFLIRLTPATGGALTDYYAGYHTLLIEDDDPAPVLTFGDVPASVVEGDTPWPLAVPWSLTGAFRGEIKIRFGTSNGPESVITPSTTQRTSTASFPANDHPNEPQTVQLKLLPSFAKSRIKSVSRNITVTDDDVPQLTLQDVTVVESQGRAVFPITLDQHPLGTVAVTWRTADGSARAGEDYTAWSGTTPYSSKGAKVEILLRNDNAAEETETFYIDVTAVSGPVQPPTRTRYVVTILDEDTPPPTVTLTTSPIAEPELSAKANVRVQLAQAATSIVSLVVAAAGGTATEQSDYSWFQIPVVFEPGQTVKDVQITIRGDYTDEKDETLVIVATDTAGNVVATTTLTIVDDDTQAIVTIADVAVVEKTGTSVTATFTVKIMPPPQAGANISYQTVAGTATAGADFAASSGTLSFAPGQGMQEISVEVFGDAIPEEDERFSIKLALLLGHGVSLGRDRGHATIYDDDDAVTRPSISVDDSNVTESGQATFTLRLSQSSSETVRLSYETADGTATAPSDYEHRAGTVTFAPGETTKTIVVPIATDAVHEETETFTVLLSNGDGVMLPDVLAICTIADDDPEGETRTRRRSARH
jgi:hypothetical protein